MRAVPALLAIAIAFASGCSRDGTPQSVLDADTQITLPEGFDAEILYSVPASQGSWVAMAFDPQGRLVVSDQDSDGVFRVTLPPDGPVDPETGVERLTGFPYDPIPWGRRTVGGALGFLFAFDSLYMSSMKGFYRIRDTDGDDTFDEFTLIKKLDVGYEHSAHCIIETEDGESLYLVSGNHSDLPDDVDSLQPPVWGLDSLLSPLPDPMGHAVGVKAPGGWICRISPDGDEWTMVASGLRNSVDLAINREGELFTADSDLEFDVGSPVVPADARQPRHVGGRVRLARRVGQVARLLRPTATARWSTSDPARRPGSASGTTRTSPTTTRTTCSSPTGPSARSTPSTWRSRAPAMSAPPGSSSAAPRSTSRRCGSAPTGISTS